MVKILCVDFDGVLHSYTSGWQGADVINDPPVQGAIEWLESMTINDDYFINIYSARSAQIGGIVAMKKWLINCGFSFIDYLEFPVEKPSAYLTIDDRAICFHGTFPSVLELDNFKPWNK